MYALREVERFHPEHRPHQGTARARPPCPLPTPTADAADITRLGLRRRGRLGGILHRHERRVTCTDEVIDKSRRQEQARVSRGGWSVLRFAAVRA
ncbi:hypothetical protein GCM10010405_50200 [Streptomyces macrosporus]|uniref:Transposase n=1 Tax=Streptomyces macrosporus TaxID=44032 RepID=A0ABP5XPL8_9ACTN